MKKQKAQELKVYKKRRRRAEWKARLNYIKNKRRKKTEAKKKRRSLTSKPKKVLLPEIFSLHSDLNGVIQFFKSINNLYKLSINSVFFDFTEVRNISNGALTVLLSQIGWLKDKGIESSGNYPRDKEAREFLINSGFLNFFKTIGTRSFEKNVNTIVARGQFHTDSALTAKIIRDANKTVWGFRDRNLKVQGMLIELMANTVNHAYYNRKYQKGWYFSVNHISEEGKVKFCFVDNGSGILNTIHLKFSDKLSSLLGINSAGDILQKAFDGEFGSRTKLSNRGRGLKAIKKAYDLGYIKCLKVLTNNVFFDFDLNESKEIDEDFNGTFYFWEIDKTCKV